MAIGALGFTARSYGRIPGANDRITSVQGANKRGKGLTLDFANAGNTAITHVCDVDSRVLAMIGKRIEQTKQPKAKMGDDIRRQLEDKDIRTLVIATWIIGNAAVRLPGRQACICGNPVRKIPARASYWSPRKEV